MEKDYRHIIIPTLGRWRQEGIKFRRATRYPISKKKNLREKGEGS